MLEYLDLKLTLMTEYYYGQSVFSESPALLSDIPLSAINDLLYFYRFQFSKSLFSIS